MAKGTSKVKNKIFIFIVLAFLVAIVGVTYSRYRGTASISTNAQIAKWAIKMNAEDISLESKTINVQAVDDGTNENVSAGKLAPGKKMKFELQVDPAGSEVAIDYIFKINSDEMKAISDTGTAITLNEQIKIEKVECTILDDNGDAQVITPTLDEEGNEKYFESLKDVLANKQVKYTVYIVWDDGDDASDTQIATTAKMVEVPITVTARQHLLQDREGEKIMSDLELLTEGETLTVSENVDFAEIYGNSLYNTMHFPNNATLDLAGKTIKSFNAGVVYLGNNLTIKNGTFTTDGSYGIFVGDEETTEDILLKDVKVEGGINVYNAHGVVLENVTVDAHKYYAVWGDENSRITINSGTYRTTENSTALFGYTSTGNEVGGFVINGGTFITNGKQFCLGGSYLPPVIYGGTFDCDVSAYVAENYQCVKANDTTWVVQK